MLPAIDDDLAKQFLPGFFGLLGVFIGALLGYWLTGAREAAKTRRAHQREIRAIQHAYTARRHGTYARQLDDWWPTAIDDYGPIKRWRLNKLRDRLRAIETPTPDWDINIESEHTPERTARHDKHLEDTRQQAMALFERIIETL